MHHADLVKVTFLYHEHLRARGNALTLKGVVHLVEAVVSEVLIPYNLACAQFQQWVLFVQEGLLGVARKLCDFIRDE